MLNSTGKLKSQVFCGFSPLRGCAAECLRRVLPEGRRQWMKNAKKTKQSLQLHLEYFIMFDIGKENRKMGKETGT
jgi:hypothetical protein